MVSNILSWLDPFKRGVVSELRGGKRKKKKQLLKCPPCITWGKYNLPLKNTPDTKHSSSTNTLSSSTFKLKLFSYVLALRSTEGWVCYISYRITLQLHSARTTHWPVTQTNILHSSAYHPAYHHSFHTAHLLYFFSDTLKTQCKITPKQENSSTPLSVPTCRHMTAHTFQKRLCFDYLL